MCQALLGMAATLAVALGLLRRRRRRVVRLLHLRDSKVHHGAMLPCTPLPMQDKFIELQKCNFPEELVN